MCVRTIRKFLHHTTLLYLPDFEAVLVVDGYKVLSKWNQVGDTPLMADVGIDLSTSLEGLDHVAVRRKHDLSLDC